MGVVRELVNPNMLAMGAAIVAGNIGTNMVLNKAIAVDPTTGRRAFSLPGVDYNQPDAATFYAKNYIVLALYKLLLPGAVGYFLRNQSPRLSQGLMISGVTMAISDLVKGSNVLASIPGMGVGRNFGAARGANSYTPGVSPTFTGPASAFLNRGLPAARRGTGAILNRNFMRNAAAASPNPFTGN